MHQVGRTNMVANECAFSREDLKLESGDGIVVVCSSQSFSSD